MDDDELAKLMREIDQFDATQPGSASAASAQPPAVPERSREVATTGAAGKGKWIVLAAVLGGVLGFVVGSVVPFFLGGFQTGVGAAIGGALAALVGQPPRWLK